MRKFFITTTEQNFLNDLNETLRSFYPYATEDVLGEEIKLYQTLKGQELLSVLELGNNRFERRDFIDTSSEILTKRHKKRNMKLLLYKTLSDMLGVSLPWGSLTGIRPTKLGYELKGESSVSSGNMLVSNFYVSKERGKLVDEIMNSQKGIYDYSHDGIDLYINIPFCVSRCSYCSFVSAILDQKKKLVSPYVQAISKEIISAQEIIQKNGYKLRSIYCGGGTPTSFSAEDLTEILKNIHLKADEFTVECGRPDSITEEKLSALKSLGVNRISINPQTFNQEVLDEIGRKHSVDDIYKAFDLAKKYDFIINMDLIADLPKDTVESFCDSVQRCIDLNPDNVTIHTLSIKRSSTMQASNYDNKLYGNQHVAQMVKKGREMLSSAGYNPYYLYRQKYTSGNLENTGYAKTGKACIYNVDVMEETTSCISCGAGGISKRVYKDLGRIDRQSIVKNIEQYIREIDQIIEKKGEFFLKNDLQ